MRILGREGNRQMVTVMWKGVAVSFLWVPSFGTIKFGSVARDTHGAGSEGMQIGGIRGRARGGNGIPYTHRSGAPGGGTAPGGRTAPGGGTVTNHILWFLFWNVFSSPS